jgi:hypothetical protein
MALHFGERSELNRLFTENANYQQQTHPKRIAVVMITKSLPDPSQFILT